MRIGFKVETSLDAKRGEFGNEMTTESVRVDKESLLNQLRKRKSIRLSSEKKRMIENKRDSIKCGVDQIP